MRLSSSSFTFPCIPSLVNVTPCRPICFIACASYWFSIPALAYFKTSCSERFINPFCSLTEFTISLGVFPARFLTSESISPRTLTSLDLIFLPEAILSETVFKKFIISVSLVRGLSPNILASLSNHLFIRLFASAFS